MRDLNHSIRSKFYPCKYWLGSNIRNLSEWVLKNAPSGIIYAKPISSINKSGNTVENSFLIDANTLTIETQDRCEDLKQGCIVKFNGDLWMVDSVQVELSVKESQFNQGHAERTVISLRK